MIRSLAALSLLLASTSALAQRGGANRDANAWDVNAPPGQTTRQVPINVDEGTWMNLDVSPDGQTIAFDLLGDIYTMPIAGGTPRRVSSGLAYDQQPRFSPDGRQLAFTSDRGGGNNIWVMNADGSGARAITSETFTLLNNPTWSPDGRFIAARKHFTTFRSAGTGEIWLYHASGTGNGVALIERPNPQHQKELGEPIFSRDGRYLYFTRDVSPGGFFQYAQDSNEGAFVIERYEMATGERTQIAGGPGGAVRAQPSPDGRLLAFVHRTNGRSRLFVRDLRSGEQRQVYADLDLDMQEVWAVEGVYPNMGWTADSNTIVFWAGGKIRRVNADGSGAAEIPFRVNDTRVVIDAERRQIDMGADSFTTRMPRFSSVSPDGRQVVYETLGRLYIRDVTGGAAPRPLTAAGGDFQLFPTWSRDGSRIAFVSWNDQRLGEIRTVAADGSDMRAVTRQPGHYRRPRFSPDGTTIVFEASGSGGLTSNRWSETNGIYRVPSTGGELTRILASGNNPHFGTASDRVFVDVFEQPRRKLISVDLNGGNRRDHAQGEMITSYEVSPDGNTLAFAEDYNLFVTPFFNGVGMLNLSARGNQMPITRVTRNGGNYMSWGGASLHWSMGPTLYSAPASNLLRTAPGGTYNVPDSGTSLAISVASERPQGVTALVGARIITMTGDDGGVIEDGVIVVDGNRIRAIGPRSAVQIPAGARQVDMAGRTIIPGLIDGHGHGAHGEDGIIPQLNWSATSHLALGVTTFHNPSTSAQEAFPAEEMQRAGLILAPRTYSSGEIVYGARQPGLYAPIDNYEDALAHVRRLRAEGAHSIKNYNQPRRNQRQQVAAAARAENLLVVPEGAAIYSMDITHIQDGNDTVEHNLPQGRLYDDVVSLWRQTRTAYNPTLVVNYGGPNGDAFWTLNSRTWDHPLLTRHTPAEALAARVRTTTAPPDQFVDQLGGREATRLARAGVLVGTGGHGQQPGLALHWDIWSHVRGGATPLEALRRGTVDNARIYGFRDVGTLEAGKLADLVVLEANPLEDITNTDNIAQVMLNGRLYDAATLNETVTGNRQRQPYYWEVDGAGTNPAAATVGHQED